MPQITTPGGPGLIRPGGVTLPEASKLESVDLCIQTLTPGDMSQLWKILGKSRTLCRVRGGYIQGMPTDSMPWAQLTHTGLVWIDIETTIEILTLCTELVVLCLEGLAHTSGDLAPTRPLVELSSLEVLEIKACSGAVAPLLNQLRLPSLRTFMFYNCAPGAGELGSIGALVDRSNPLNLEEHRLTNCSTVGLGTNIMLPLLPEPQMATLTVIEVWDISGGIVCALTPSATSAGHDNLGLVPLLEDLSLNILAPPPSAVDLSEMANSRRREVHPTFERLVTNMQCQDGTQVLLEGHWTQFGFVVRLDPPFIRPPLGLVGF